MIRAIFVVVALFAVAGCTQLNATASPQSTIVDVPSTPNTMRLSLPDECLARNPQFENNIYTLFKYDTGGCKLLRPSPDGKLLAYVTLQKREATEVIDQYVDTVKLLHVGLSEGISIHTVIPKDEIVNMAWSATGQLVYSAVYFIEGLGSTTIYDPSGGKIIASIDGTMRNGLSQ